MWTVSTRGEKASLGGRESHPRANGECMRNTKHTAWLFPWLLDTLFFPCRAALDRAAVLLRIKRDVNQLDNVWGVGGGQRPVKHLIKEVKSWKWGCLVCP